MEDARSRNPSLAAIDFENIRVFKVKTPVEPLLNLGVGPVTRTRSSKETAASKMKGAKRDLTAYEILRYQIKAFGIQPDFLTHLQNSQMVSNALENRTDGYITAVVYHRPLADDSAYSARAILFPLTTYLPI